MHHNLQIKFQFHSPSSSFNDVAGSIVIDMVRNGEHEYTLNLPTGDIRVWRRSLTTAFPSIDWRSHRHLTATMCQATPNTAPLTTSRTDPLH